MLQVSGQNFAAYSWDFKVYRYYVLQSSCWICLIVIAKKEKYEHFIHILVFRRWIRYKHFLQILGNALSSEIMLFKECPGSVYPLYYSSFLLNAYCVFH